jgi:hypothetical protein
MIPRPVLAVCTLAVLLIAGCRREDLPFDDGPVAPPGGTFDARMSFNWTGLPSSFRSYTRMRVAYAAAANVTTIETVDDSLRYGRLQMTIQGGTPGTYRYHVTGSAADTNQVFLRFVPQYYNGTAVAEFLLTGQPADSLEAEVTILSFGAPGDTVEGRFAATLAMAGGGGTRILIYGGTFLARRTE